MNQQRVIRNPPLPGCISDSDAWMIVQSDEHTHCVLESAMTEVRAARAARWLTDHERRWHRPTVYSILSRADCLSAGLLPSW